MSLAHESTSRKGTTSERLIAAALEMFSRRGMAATTREIAEAAGVNEVTLFRLFESKDQLLAAVVSEVVRAESEALDGVDFEDFDMRRDILTVAEVYYATHEQYQHFMRTMLAQRFHPKLTQDIMRDVIQPLREKFIRYLAEGQRRGLIRAEVELSPAVDAFTGMIFSAVLRRAVFAPGYSREAYLRTCVDLFLQGICVGKRN
ncbi:MAG TPA: helix-turn-helix domain-containing protein [Bryobacteraceae bacterium]|nr:helix-turn-helix domain-containing protein [Bryobacteraceae bacterium]